MAENFLSTTLNFGTSLSTTCGEILYEDLRQKNEFTKIDEGKNRAKNPLFTGVFDWKP